jgi:hypothetical protein
MTVEDEESGLVTFGSWYLSDQLRWEFVTVLGDARSAGAHGRWGSGDGLEGYCWNPFGFMARRVHEGQGSVNDWEWWVAGKERQGRKARKRSERGTEKGDMKVR